MKAFSGGFTLDNRAARRKAKRRKEREQEKQNIQRTMENLTPDEIIAGTVEFNNVLWFYTLHEVFGFGKNRIEKAFNYYNATNDAINEKYVEWQDIYGVLRDEVKLKL